MNHKAAEASPKGGRMRSFLQILLKKAAKISELVFVAAVIAPIMDPKYLSYPVIIVSFVCCILTLTVRFVRRKTGGRTRFAEDSAQDQKVTAAGPLPSPA